MSETWIGTLLALLGGGAMGALIKIAYDFKRDRIQTVSRGIRVFPLFRRDRDHKDFDAVLSVVHDGRSSEFRTLFVADVMLRNRSNHDYSEFEFGISIAENSKCVHVGWENPDQHHILSLLDVASPSEPRSQLKFRLRPFNRRDAYSLRLYLAPELQEDPVIESFSSPHAVRFVDDPRFSERASDLLPNYIIWGIGSMLLGLLASMSYQYYSASRLLEKSREQQRIQREDAERQEQTFRRAIECHESKGRFIWTTLECIEEDESSGARP